VTEETNEAVAELDARNDARDHAEARKMLLESVGAVRRTFAEAAAGVDAKFRVPFLDGDLHGLWTNGMFYLLYKHGAEPYVTVERLEGLVDWQLLVFLVEIVPLAYAKLTWSVHVRRNGAELSGETALSAALAARATTLEFLHTVKS